MVSAITAISGLALLAGAVQAQNYNSTVVVTATTQNATIVSTDIVTVTSCTGENVVSCHYVTTTSPAAVSSAAPPTTEAPAPAVSTKAVVCEECEEKTTIITVIEGVTVTVIGTSTLPPAPVATSNATGVAPVAPVETETEIPQTNGQSVIKAGLGSIAIGAIAALLM